MQDWRPPIDSDTLGGRLGRTREALGLDAGALARRVGVDVDRLNEWEKDQAEPPANELVALAGILGVSPAWMIGGRGEDDGTVELDEKGRAAKIGVLRDRRDSIDREIARLEAQNAADRRENH